MLYRYHHWLDYYTDSILIAGVDNILMFKALQFSLLSLFTLTSYAHTTQVLNGYWQYDEYLEAFPAQKNTNR